MNLKRSDFIKLGSMTAVGAMAIPTLLNSCANASGVACSCPELDVEQRIKDLGLELPAAPSPGLFKPVLVSGNLLYVSGQGPNLPDGTQVLGKVGADLTLEDGQFAARQVGLTMISVIKAYFGDLNQICRLVKTLGMVNCTPDFYSTPAVINGFSQLMIDIWGEDCGKGVRSAVGMVSLPSNIAVEVECIFELKS
jgi:enamine deaminase RidA (YjgF/YER057c/UK114 family)